MNTADLLSIKEFSDFTGIKQSILRYYDEINLFNPIMRGKNNYRYYSCQQIVTVNLINVLVNLNIPRKKILELTQLRSPQLILELLSNQEHILDAQIRGISESYSIIHTFRKLIEMGFSVQENVLYEEILPSFHISLGKRNHLDNYSQFYPAFINYCHESKMQGTNLNYPIGGYYENIAAFTEMPSQPTHFFSLTPSGKDIKPAGNHIVGYLRGYYGEMADFPQKLKNYATHRNLTLSHPIYVIYLHDEISISDPNQYLAQISTFVPL